MNQLEMFISKACEIEKQLGYTFHKKELLALSFSHRSFYNENREFAFGHNERLEFLGDAVLDLIVSDYLYRKLPSHSEGHLSHLRAHLVGAVSCSEYLHKLKLESYLLLGRGESINMGKGRQRILADLFEAIIGAIYLDGGLEVAREFFFRFFQDIIDTAINKPLRNWKAELQDYSQKKYQTAPQYCVIEAMGPSHKRTFIVGAMIEKEEWGRGEGTSKKEAQQAAAEDALRRIEREGENGKD